MPQKEHTDDPDPDRLRERDAGRHRPRLRPNPHTNPHTNPVRTHLRWLIRQIADAESAVRSIAGTVADSAQDTTARLAAGRILNRYGELQSEGPRFDAAVARLATLREAYDSAVEMARDLNTAASQ